MSQSVLPLDENSWVGECWNCGMAVLRLEPDPGMRCLTDRVICTRCGEVQEVEGD